ncbi:MAG: FKBP-type peptidyl-prolyl cis-trans isomerase [Gammaproteobacteria bacterium]|jgi:FKBP-type peptidyl-prolyl cis-trans isomerase FkpA|nr:FKBP-type peptidyl-prolyl cis-trans isomerase [Gammaproteobacteria bacterium]
MQFACPKPVAPWLAAVLLAASLSACQPQAADSAAPAESQPAVAGAPITALQITDTLVGDGAVATPGRDIVVHYTGWLYDPTQPDNKGRQFDSSVDRGQPFVFPLGAGRVIQGWEQGFDGMQIGGKRTLIIPPDMAYGKRGAGAAIPPNATLLFEVELLDIRQ